MDPGPSEATHDLPAARQARKSTSGAGLPGGGRDAERAARARDDGPERDRRLRCRVCGAAITSPDQRLAIAGGHVHRRTNPADVDFEFGCFADAPGAAVHGRPTAEHSWFAGYLWSFAACRRCDAHLGWFFEGREPAFFGLILSQLSEAD